MLTDASGLESGRKFRLNLSHYPKVEVASGMITERPRNDDEFFDELKINREIFQKEAKDEFICNSVLSGGEFYKGNEKIPAEAFISAYDVADGIRVTGTDEFEKFIDCFNDASKLWADGIPFDYEVAEDLIRDTNSFYVALKGEDKKKIFLEPVFMVELKYFIERLRYDE